MFTPSFWWWQKGGDKDKDLWRESDKKGRDKEKLWVKARKLKSRGTVTKRGRTKEKMVKNDVKLRKIEKEDMLTLKICLIIYGRGSFIWN